MPLAPRVPDLGALEMLLSVARSGSFGRAAQELGVTQPAIASRISRMEHLVGLSLVQRGPRGSTLTPTGALLADWAAEVLAAASALEHGIDALRSKERDGFRVAASMTIAEYLVPDWLEAARAEGLMVSLHAANSTDVVDRVRDGHVDLGFVEAPGPLTGVDSTVVARDSLLVVARRDHPWARRHEISIAELAATSLVQREPGSGTRSTLDGALAAQSSRAAPALECLTTSAVRTAVEEGIAPGVISSLALGSSLRSGRLVRVAVESLDLSRSLRAVWPAGEVLVGARRGFTMLARRTSALRAE